MEVSLFLAKLVGLYFFIGGLICIFRRNQIMSMAAELGSLKSTLAVSGEISLIFGLVIVLDHFLWELNWRGLITLLGCLLIIKGIVRMAFPAYVKKLIMQMTKTSFTIMSLVMLAIGLYLTYCGFTTNVVLPPASGY